MAVNFADLKVKDLSDSRLDLHRGEHLLRSFEQYSKKLDMLISRIEDPQKYHKKEKL